MDGQAPLRQILGRLGGGHAVLLVTSTDTTADEPKAVEHWFGAGTDEEQEGLRRCARADMPRGAEPGLHEAPNAWFLPLRGSQRSHGAALVRLDSGTTPPETERSHAQALCDQLGAALERATAEQAASRAHRQAHLQSMRNTLLSAVAHDHRTPLATIISAAGALHDQADRLDAAQRERLAATILDEAMQLARITDNTLQLARLDAVGLDLIKDWESPEELIGSVMRRLRQRDPDDRLRVRVDPGLALVRCDAVLVVQVDDVRVQPRWLHVG